VRLCQCAFLPLLKETAVIQLKLTHEQAEVLENILWDADHAVDHRIDSRTVYELRVSLSKAVTEFATKTNPED
jgi:hypothetical protein